MSEKRIVVPEGMLKAALASAFGYTRETMCFAMLEAALRWLSENPIVPTIEQANDMASKSPLGDSFCRFAAVEWQRRMLLAPEPEIPEAIKDLLLNETIPSADFSRPTRQYHNSQLLEAYRRGKEGK